MDEPVCSDYVGLLSSGNVPESAKIWNQIMTTKKFKAEPFGLCGLGTSFIVLSDNTSFVRSCRRK